MSPEPVSPEEVRMGPQGRIVIEKRDALIRRLQARFAHLAPDVDLVA